MKQNQAPIGSSTAGVMFSGGLDSAILTLSLLDAGQAVQPFYIDSGLFWQTDERRAAERFLERIAGPRLFPIIEFALPADDLYGGHWSISGIGVPDDESDDREVYLPGRNLMLLAKPAIWCQMHGIAELAIGALDANPFADATEGFMRDFANLVNAGEETRVKITRPLSGTDKTTAVRRWSRAPLELTFSCIAPRDGLHCGQCNKCAERQRAFQTAGIADQSRYRMRVAVSK